MTKNSSFYSTFKKLLKVSPNLYLTKLTGYYGLMNIRCEVLIKNEYEKIRPLYDTFVLKKYGKYGLVDINGKVILDAENDKIKKLGEYILVKKDGLYQVYSANGDLLSDKFYKKVRIERNVLQGKVKGEDFEPVVYM